MALLNWTVSGSVLTVEMPNSMPAYPDSEWQELTSALLIESATLYLLDFSHTTSVQPAAFRLLLELCRAVDTNKKHIASLKFNDRLLAQIKSLGLERRLNPSMTTEEAMKKAGITPRPTASAALLNMFIKATQTVLDQQASTPCKPLKAQILTGEQKQPPNIAIAGVLSIDAAKFKGTIALCFPKESFLKIYSNMLGEDVADISDETKDAASELLNIIYGMVKAELNKTEKMELPPAIPTVITGERLSVRQSSRTPVLIVPFEMSPGIFHVEIALDPA